MTTLTQWFDPKIDGQPVRVGYYERMLSGLSGYDYWDGNVWRYNVGSHPMISKNLRWRGLTEPNEEKQ